MLPSLVDGTQPSPFSVDADVGVSAGRLNGEFRTQEVKNRNFFLRRLPLIWLSGFAPGPTALYCLSHMIYLVSEEDTQVQCAAVLLCICWDPYSTDLMPPFHRWGK